MPTLSIKKDTLLRNLEELQYTDEDVEDRCFEFGVELDDITSEYEMKRREQGEEKAEGASKDVLYKIDLPANRYDLVCGEGFCTALRVYLGKMKTPNFRTTPPKLTMKVAKSVKGVRSFCVCAVLRNLNFTLESYNSFIDLQDKLHQNLARKRTLVSVGTHDLDTIEGPFTYEAVPRKDIKFVPLSKTQPVTGEKFIETIQQEKHLARYLHIIEDLPDFPLIRDKNNVVLSLPPIINGDHSKITTNTKNVFIEITATDKHKANMMLHLIVCAFSQYCQDTWSVEQVNIEYEDGLKEVTPNLVPRTMACDTQYISRSIGVEMTPKLVIECLDKMMLTATQVDANTVEVKIPANRPDVLHACDIMEDAAVAYGYDKIEQSCVPVPTVSIATQQPVMKLTHLIRQELANAGYHEILTFGLCSFDEAYTKLCKAIPAAGSPEDIAVKIANPQTAEFQVCRISLLPGMLKTLFNFSSAPRPIRIFEVSDVILKDATNEVGCRNQRNVAAMYSDISSGLEMLQGLLDYTMKKLGTEFKEASQIQEGDNAYTIQPSTDSTFCSHRQAAIIYKGAAIGIFGILNPKVTKDGYGISFPVSYMEFNLHPFFE